MDRLPIILLVDDDPNDEELARVALARAGVPHALEVVRDGPEALEWLQARGSWAQRDVELLPRVVLLDLKLPKMTGLEVLEQIRTDPRTRGLPVVVFTSSLEERDLIESYRLGVNAYVRKPVDFGEYKQVMADVGRFWIRHNQLPLAAGERDGVA